MEKEKKFSLSALIGNLLCIIFIPIIVINVILIVGSYIHPEELPGIFDVKPAVVLSGSMEPTIRTGDLIFIHTTDVSALKEGDVICYLTSGKAVTHRIAGVTTGDDGLPRFVTKGDANNAEDRLAVTQDQVQGIWKGGRIGKMGDFILFMQTTTGMIIFIICPLLLFFLWDIWRRRRLDLAEAEKTARLEAELEALKKERKSSDTQDALDP